MFFYSKFKNLAAFALMGAACIIGMTAPVFAEREQEILYEYKDLDKRGEIQQIEAQRINKIMYSYTSQMETVEKADNNVRYLLNQSSRYTDKALQDYLNNEVIPRSSELVNMANSITSQSSAIRELHDIFISYVTARHQALVNLATYANKRVPRSQVARYISGYGFSAGSYSYTEEHKSNEAYTVTAAMNRVIAAGDQRRNEYLNKKAYIIRNKGEVITHEK